jgi:hypothetical protein
MVHMAKFAFSLEADMEDARSTRLVSWRRTAFLVGAHETHEAYWSPQDHTRLVLPRRRPTLLVSNFEIEGDHSRRNVGGKREETQTHPGVPLGSVASM